MEPNTSFPAYKILLGAGLLLLLFGFLAWALQGKLGWIGRLPGDIRIEKAHFRFYFPITTMILLSLLVNVLMRIFKWWSANF